MPKETYIPCLIQLFRQYGYDGTTLTKISQATGLGKASLYHHFPGGKDQMMETVLDFIEDWLDQNILQPLAGPGDAHTRLQTMCDRFSSLYAGGPQPCIFAILLMDSTPDVFHEKVKAIFQAWVLAIAQVLIEVGMDRALAQECGENAVIAIQGSLILSKGLGDPAPFQRVIQQLPRQLCQR